jgi:hypothetical protein
MSSKRLSDKLKESLIEIEKIVPDHKLYMLHFTSGTIENPYSYRLSGIKIENDTFNPLLGFMSHEVALRKYIQYFNRDNTFLHNIIDRIKNDIKGDNKYKNGLILDLEIVPDEDINNRFFDCSSESILKFSNKYFSKLFPSIRTNGTNESDNAIDLFFKELYQNNWNDKSKNNWKTLFDQCRQAIFAELINLKLIELDENLTQQVELIEKSLKEISSYQSGFLYFIKTLDFGERAIIKNKTSTVISFKDYNSRINSLGAVTLIVTPKLNENNKKENVLEVLKKVYFNISNERKELSSRTHVLNEYLKNYLSDDIKSILGDKYKETFPYYRINPEPIVTYSLWLASILKKLHNRIHEGNKLSFYFLLADKSEFEDHPNIVLKEIKAENDNLVTLFYPGDTWNNLNEEEIGSDQKEKLVIQRANNIVELLAKEHFPWFENGRYALLWDINSDFQMEESVNSEMPKITLVSLKNTDWEVVTSKIFFKKKDTRLEVPNSFLFAINPKDKISSIFSISKSKIIEEAVIFKDRWLQNLYKKKKQGISTYFNDVRKIHSSLKEFPDGFLDIIVRISEDPGKGGTIALLKDETDNGQFHAMGFPWELENGNYEVEDLISLISHDGASVCLNCDSNKWRFRKLLLPLNVPHLLIELLSNHFKNNFEVKKGFTIRGENLEMENYCPLSFVGSRRWNGAISSLDENVFAVVIISQDGNIIVWHNSLTKNDFKKIRKAKSLADIGIEKIAKKIFVSEMDIEGNIRPFTIRTTKTI